MYISEEFLLQLLNALFEKKKSSCYFYSLQQGADRIQDKDLNVTGCVTHYTQGV